MSSLNLSYRYEDPFLIDAYSAEDDGDKRLPNGRPVGCR